METKERLDYIENNYAQNGAIDKLTSKIQTLQSILVSSGILEETAEQAGTLYHINNKMYKVKES